MSRRIKKRGYKVNIEKLRVNAIDRAAKTEGAKAETASESSKEASSKALSELADTHVVEQDSQPAEPEPGKATVDASNVDNIPSADQSDHKADRQEAATPDDKAKHDGEDQQVDLLHDRKTVDNLVSAALTDGVEQETAAGAGKKSKTEIDEDTKILIEEAFADSTVDVIGEYGDEDDEPEQEDTEDEDKWTSEDLKTFDQLEEDDVLADSNESGAVRVLDSIVVYETENWMNEQTGKPYNRVRLRQQPPTIKFKQHVSGDETGEYDSEVKLVVTRKLAMQLGFLFDAIVASYDGRPIEDKDKKPVTLESAKQWLSDQWKYEPGKVIVVAVLAVLAIVLGVYAKFVVH